MRFRSSLAAAMAAAVTAVVFTAASQPVEAAIYTWRTGAAGGGSATAYSNANNWVGGVAAVSSTASTTLQFTSNTTSGSMSTTPGTDFGVNQLIIDGTTTYVQGGNLNMADGGTIVNTSSVRQVLNAVRPNGAGFTATSTSGTLAINMNYTNTGRTVTLGGSGAKEILSTNFNIGAGIVGNGGQITLGVGQTPTIYGDVTMNAGSLIVPIPTTTIQGSFTAAAGVPVSIVGNGLNPGFIANASTVNYGGMGLNINLTSFYDVTTGTDFNFGDPVSNVIQADAYSGNLGSMASTASSGPYVGLTWLASGSNWVSSQFNGNQQLEFRPAEGTIYLVPEPTQMVFVAGVGAALGMWRMRKLRRNGRGSDATTC